MDSFRHAVALLLTVVMPPLLLYWCLLHPWVRFWRRLGAPLAMTLLWSVVILGAAVLFFLRGRLLAGDLGMHPAAFAAGVVCLLVATWMRRELSRRLTLRVLAGLAEIAPEEYPPVLITDGLHGRVRHPRYLQLLLALLGWALVANYPAAYAVFALWVPGVWLIVRLEEAELRQRFGPAYEAYCRRVPRFVPRFRGFGR